MTILPTTPAAAGRDATARSCVPVCVPCVPVCVPCVPACVPAAAAVDGPSGPHEPRLDNHDPMNTTTERTPMSDLIPTAPVVAYTPPRQPNHAAIVDVICPLGCIRRDRWRRPVLDEAGLPVPLTHRHGAGMVGEAPTLGHRAAHCRGTAEREGEGNLVTDPDGLVPVRVEIAPALLEVTR